MIKKVTKAEGKAKILAFVSCNIDQYYYQGSRLMHMTTAKANIQLQKTKNLWLEESKVCG